MLLYTQTLNQELFQGIGVFLELGHFYKHSPAAQEKKSREKISDFFGWNS